MSYYPNKKFLIRTSSGSSFYFFFSESGGIIYDYFNEDGFFYNTTTLIEKNVIDFSVEIDKDDRIHLLLLTKNGELIYYIYFIEKWSNSTLTTLNMKANKYKYFKLIITKNTIHIFYTYSSLINSNVWTIQHIYSINKRWEKKNVVTITPDKFISPYYVDYDKKGNIHLIFKDIINDQQHVYYTYYDFLNKKWNKYPKKISELETDNLHPYLFVDTKDNVHVIWCALSNSNLQLLYKQLTYENIKKIKWTNFTLPDVHGNCTHPLIFEDKGILKILYRQNDMLKNLYSNDYGYTWQTSDSTSDTKIESLNYINYSTNFLPEKLEIKINHFYDEIKDTVTIFSSGANNHNTNKNNAKSKNETINQKAFYLFNNKTKQQNSYEANDIKFSILDNLESIKDKNIKEFISSTKEGLNLIFARVNKKNSFNEEIEKLIYENVKILDEKNTSKDIVFVEITKELENLKTLFEKFKEENNIDLELLTSINGKFDRRTSKINKIESELSQIQKIVEDSKRSTLFNKIIKKFK